MSAARIEDSNVVNKDTSIEIDSGVSNGGHSTRIVSSSKLIVPPNLVTAGASPVINNGMLTLVFSEMLTLIKYRQ